MSRKLPSVARLRPTLPAVGFSAALTSGCGGAAGFRSSGRGGGRGGGFRVIVGPSDVTGGTVGAFCANNLADDVPTSK